MRASVGVVRDMVWRRGWMEVRGCVTALRMLGAHPNTGASAARRRTDRMMRWRIFSFRSSSRFGRTHPLPRVSHTTLLCIYPGSASPQSSALSSPASCRLPCVDNCQLVLPPTSHSLSPQPRRMCKAPKASPPHIHTSVARSAVVVLRHKGHLGDRDRLLLLAQRHVELRARLVEPGLRKRQSAREGKLVSERHRRADGWRE